jgi:hypothetical protein
MFQIDQVVPFVMEDSINVLEFHSLPATVGLDEHHAGPILSGISVPGDALHFQSSFQPSRTQALLRYSVAVSAALTSITLCSSVPRSLEHGATIPIVFEPPRAVRESNLTETCLGAGTVEV